MIPGSVPGINTTCDNVKMGSPGAPKGEGGSGLLKNDWKNTCIYLYQGSMYQVVYKDVYIYIFIFIDIEIGIDYTKDRNTYDPAMISLVSSKRFVGEALVNDNVAFSEFVSSGKTLT